MTPRRSGGGAGCGTVIVICMALAYCSHRSFQTDDTPASRQAISAQSAEIDGESAGGAAAQIGDDDEERGGETYPQYDQRRDQIATGLYSGGDECTEDCSGHDAGREWAEQRGITSPDDCGGKSWSFEEGCRSYAEEQQSSSGDDAEAGEEGG